MPSTITYKSTFIVLLIAVGYLLLSQWLIGYKLEQLILVGLFLACYFISSITRKFIIGFSVFIIFWLLFDYMKAFPNYLYNKVHVADLYNAEKLFFGLVEAGKRVTPNEYWLNHHATWLDVLCGIFYLSWVPVPLGFAVILFFKNRDHFFQFSLSFLLVNLIGFSFYYIYPAAPPWYVQQHGFDFIAGTPGNMAGLSRFDQFFNVTIFKGLYEKSSNVFAAMPSLHSAYPLIVLYYGIKFKLGIWNALFATIMVGIWFAAVYTSHHYVLDVIAGILCSLTGIALFQLMLKKSKAFSILFYKAVAVIK